MTFIALNAGGGYPFFYSGMSIYDVLVMLGVIAFFLIINKIFNRKPLEFPVNENLELEQYTFGFEETHVNIKNRSLPIRILVCVISTLLIITPLNEFFGGLNYPTVWVWMPL